MMLHRHFEADREKMKQNMTVSKDVQPSDSTDPNDPLYVPLEKMAKEEESKTRRGKARKE